jgi:hypothetical protein
MSSKIIGGDYISAITGGVLSLESIIAVGTRSETLENSPAVILRAYVVDGLEELSYPESNGDWPCWVSVMPDDRGNETVPDNAAAVFDSPGTGTRLMSGQQIERFGVQVKVRGIDYTTVWKKLESIATALDGVKNVLVSINSDEYLILNISRRGPIIPMPETKTTKRRFTFVINMLITLKKVT